MCPKKLQQTQQSQKPRTDRDKQTPHTQPTRRPATHAAPISHGRNLGKIQRCSRPLCSSQATDEPTSQPWTPHPTHPRRDRASRYDQEPVTRTHPETPHHRDPAPTSSHPNPKERTTTRDDQIPRPVASGPNSVLGEPTPTGTVSVPTPDPRERGEAY